MTRIVTVLLLGLMLVPAAGARAEKVLVIGFDGMDPQLLSEFRAQGVLPGSADVSDSGTDST